MRITESAHTPEKDLETGQIAVRSYLYEKKAIQRGLFNNFKVHREFPGANIPAATVRVNAENLIQTKNENGEIEVDPFTLQLAAGELVGLMEALELSIDAVVGVPSGGTTLAKEAGRLMSSRRKFSGVTVIPVEKGRFQDIPKGEGRPRVVVIEDVITTATSSIELVKALQAAEYEVVAVITLVDREQWGRERLEKMGVQVRAVLTLEQILRGKEEYVQDMEAERAMREALKAIFGYE